MQFTCQLGRSQPRAQIGRKIEENGGLVRDTAHATAEECILCTRRAAFVQRSRVRIFSPKERRLLVGFAACSRAKPVTNRRSTAFQTWGSHQAVSSTARTQSGGAETKTHSQSNRRDAKDAEKKSLSLISAFFAPLRLEERTAKSTEEANPASLHCIVSKSSLTERMWRWAERRGAIGLGLLWQRNVR